MKISKIKIDSVYGVKHLELDGRPIELRGAKGTGKTSVIDSIRLALTNKSDRDYIIKNGERESEIIVETDSGISITRKKRTDSSDYDKVTEFGKQVQKQQSFINEIFTPLQLNPVEFCSWDKNTQNREILNLIEFDWDLDWIKQQFGELPRGVNYDQHVLQVLEDIKAKNGYYWLQREDCNRKELYKRQQITDIAQKFPDGYDVQKWSTYDIQETSTELSKRQKCNSEIERAKAFMTAYTNKKRGHEAERDIAITAAETAINAERTGLISSIERMKAEIIAAEDALVGLNDKLSDKKTIYESNYQTAMAKLDADMGIAEEYANKEIQDISILQEELNHAIKMKEFVSEYKTMLSMKKECVELKQQSDYYDTQITLARELPGLILSSCTLPIEGLTVQDGVPLVNGLPISNLSDGEKIELCVDITLSQPHKLEMILLNGVEQLDDISRQRIYDKCKAKGLQIIAARTTNDNELEIFEL